MKPKEMDHVVVYRDDGVFAAWPFNGGFWQFADGELAVSFMRASCTYATPESTNHKTIDQDGCEQVLIRSFDGGLTWPSETLSPVFRRAELDEHVRAGLRRRDRLLGV